ncbi:MULTISPECIES: hypothetical protein [Paenibacillus]|uniref:hypothetical protein n=1 Tax=Paenibacillus TaxID=44249 RepID=UPI00096D3669|nr:hypothetical protein [Paenibacillus odorifer]OME10734.1 hypothetical protein BSK60_23810 [Paenibacillus odorifer]
MSNRYSPLQENQRIEVYLKNGEIMEGRFCEWLPIEGSYYLLAHQEERIVDGKLTSSMWSVNETIINLIYPL